MGELAAARDEALRQAEAEGLKLPRTSSASGYVGVVASGSHFRAQSSAGRAEGHRTFGST